MKAEKFKVVVSGLWKGNPYRYEETVPASQYQVSNWWLKFMSGDKRKAIEALNNAEVGQHFTWEEKGTRTEIIAE